MYKNETIRYSESVTVLVLVFFTNFEVISTFVHVYSVCLM